MWPFYDGFFQLSDAGLGGALAIVLTLIGTLVVAAIFTIIGAGASRPATVTGHAE